MQFTEKNKKYVMQNIEMSFLIKIGHCSVYRVNKKKYRDILLKCPDVVEALDRENFENLLQIDDQTSIIVSSYLINLENLEKILQQADASHRIFFETFINSSQKVSKTS